MFEIPNDFVFCVELKRYFLLLLVFFISYNGISTEIERIALKYCATTALQSTLNLPSVTTKCSRVKNFSIPSLLTSFRICKLHKTLYLSIKPYLKSVTSNNVKSKQRISSKKYKYQIGRTHLKRRGSIEFCCVHGLRWDIGDVSNKLFQVFAGLF